MPAARKAAGEVRGEVERVEHAVDGVFARIHILPNFGPGDRLDGKIADEHLRVLVEQGDAGPAEHQE